ncbi:GAF domain-containing sensor histidine kinase [Anaerolineales bacterium HSG6]|nr:GAF domain-containing sensor histidine kinase [Anaerolineales bacterium HSG6]MDM8532533.1 GAF domain-containing sensor histidine kinase [Anaerolineales bacterium HSG25]
METAQVLDKPVTNKSDLEQTLIKANRRAALLSAATQVSRSLTSILDPDELLTKTVDIICDAYGFYYAGIFLIEDASDGRRWAVLRAGRGRAGQLMMQHKHKLEVGGRSMIGACTSLNEVRAAFDVGKEAVWFNNPFLPDTRSEMALPLAIGRDVIGALTVQSVEESAFSDEDISSLQALADQLAVAINNARLHQQNMGLLQQAARRAALLQAGARVSRKITSILDLHELVFDTVETICTEYDFYYAGIFLINEDPDDDGRTWAILRAGSGEAGRIMMENNHKLEVGGNSMIGAATGLNEARISLDVGEEKVWFNNPYLPKTRSEMALPLHIHSKVIGALTIQSEKEAAFSPEDISSLQIMADQLAVAINNARLLQDLEGANKELVRTKTFESIATATGETIHWVGNKAAPIPACVNRIREDLANFLYISKELIVNADDEVQNVPVAQLLVETGDLVEERFPETEVRVNRLKKRPLKKLRRMLDIESVLEDLEIIENSGNTILQIKEDLIGPARRQRWRQANVVEIIQDNIKGMALPKDTVIYSIEGGNIPTVKVDPMQMGRVIINLVKNAMEAMDDQPHPQIFIAMRQEDDDFVVVDIADNGGGIPEEELTKIWLTFHTSKAKKGGTGLGLPACLQTMERMGGKIAVTSEVGIGSTFTLHVPIYKPGDEDQEG